MSYADGAYMGGSHMALASGAFLYDMGYGAWNPIAAHMTPPCEMFECELLHGTLEPAADAHHGASRSAIFSMCTHVVVLCALNDETRGLVDGKHISLMPTVGADGTPCGNHLVNMARGGIVVEEEAAACLQEGSLSS